ncbi:MAG: ABC transporter ATP-binding protein [Deltaproteobacteria bacterium]|nr:ABC transporter ATP-binding protein [Deltaproteobacteria bacterium]
MEKRNSSLRVEEIYTAYDRADVLENLSLKVVQGTITCLLGNNGSGKTTVIRSILGLTPPRSGRILFEDEDITRLPTHKIIRRGIASIPEGRKVFPGLTVEENLRLGGYQEDNKAVLLERMKKVYEIFPRLEERTTQLAGTMSGGEQAMVSIGRGLMSAPRLLIVDEPSLGLSPLLVKENFRIIQDIRNQNVTVFLVEQNVRQTLAISDYGYVLSKGGVVAEGDAGYLRDNKEVQEAYFG